MIYIFNLKLLEGEEHTQENFKGTINMFVDDEEPQFLVQNQIIKFYFKEPNGLFTGYFEQTFRLYQYYENYIISNSGENTLYITDNVTTTQVSPRSFNFATPQTTKDLNTPFNCSYDFSFVFNEKTYSLTNDSIYLTFNADNNRFNMTDLNSYINTKIWEKNLVIHSSYESLIYNGPETQTKNIILTFNVILKQNEDNNYFLVIKGPPTAKNQIIETVNAFNAEIIPSVSGNNMYNFDTLPQTFYGNYTYYVTTDKYAEGSITNEKFIVTSSGITI